MHNNDSNREKDNNNSKKDRYNNTLLNKKTFLFLDS